MTKTARQALDAYIRLLNASDGAKTPITIGEDEFIRAALQRDELVGEMITVLTDVMPFIGYQAHVPDIKGRAGHLLEKLNARGRV